MDTYTLVYSTGHQVKKDFISPESAIEYAQWETNTLKSRVFVRELEYINEGEKFWEHSYMVALAAIGAEYLVNADNEQDALDYAIDYAEENGWMGYFIDNPTEEELESHASGGNHGLVLSDESAPFIRQID